MATAQMTDQDVKKKATQNQKALDTAITQIERSYGKGAIMRMGEDSFANSIEAIPTGAINLDAAIGIGGIPRGRSSEIYGPESSGKTTLCLQVIANAQRLGGIAAFVDAEHALDVTYARKLGVDVDNLLVSQPDTGEQALEIAEVLIRSNAIDVVVIDSVAALVPRAEIEGEMGDTHVGLQARLMSQALRKLTSSVAKSKTLIIFINQIEPFKDLLPRIKKLKKMQSKKHKIKTPPLYMDTRDFGIGAQILHDLNINKLRIISNSSKKPRVGLTGYGLEIVEHVRY